VRIDSIMRGQIARLQTESDDLGRLVRARETPSSIFSAWKP
jgi:hypothetical protein